MGTIVDSDHFMIGCCNHSCVASVSGKSRTIDILSMAHRNKPVRFGVSCGYGFPADFIVQSKKHGWFNKAGVPSLHAVKQHRLVDRAD